MAEGEPKLRVVDEGGDPPQRVHAGAAAIGGSRWVVLALAVALAVCVALLLWSRAQLGARIEGLQEQVAGLRARVVDLNGQVEARDRTIAAHERRLDDVRDHLDQLRALLDEPVQAD